jgi:hypothetical protein
MMAALPPENTARLYVDYNDGVNLHTLVVRYNEDPGQLLVALAHADAVFTEMSPNLYAVTIAGARFSLKGSNVTNPAVWSGAASYGAGVMPAVSAPLQFMFGGKSQDGRLVAWYFFGCKLAVPATYRYAGGVVAGLDDTGDAIAAAGLAGAFLTISGAVPLVKTYVNVNWNSYWEAEPR